MSLYLSEWLDGPNQFIEFGNVVWSPHVYCNIDSKNPAAVSTFITAFDVDALNELVTAITEICGEETGKTLMARYNVASVILLGKFVGAKKLVEENINKVYKSTGGNITETSEILSDLLGRRILDFEFWNKIDLIEVYSNLIFYGTLYDPKPIIFITPPMSEWDDTSDDWYDLESYA